MKNNLILFVLIIVLSYIALMFLPWWSVAVLSLILCTVIPLTRYSGFWIPFTAILILYAIVASLKNLGNEQILGDVVADMFQMPSSWIVILFGGILYALVCGMSGYTGTLLRRIFRTETVNK